MIRWTPRFEQEELALCQRFYEKSFAPDTKPAQAGGYAGAVYLQSQAATAGGCWCPFKVTKRNASFTITTYNPTQAANSWRNLADTVNGTAVTSLVLNGVDGIGLQMSTSQAGGFAIQWSIENDL
jgi:hypothetical protein